MAVLRVEDQQRAEAVAMVLPVEWPAAEAVDCIQLFSTSVIARSRPPLIERRPFHSTNDITHDVIAMPKAQPS